MTHISAVAIGFLIDIIIGDPQWIYHPIRFIGALIAKTEQGLRKIFPKSNKGLLVAGLFEVVIVLVISTGVTLGILKGCYVIHPILGYLVECTLCYFFIAAKALKVESMKVYNELINGDMKKARYALSMIVGRDTMELTQEEVVRACVETVAENNSDGVIAPIIYLVLGGPVLGVVYKAINTMDSMIGYRNEQYLYFGRVAARLDDIANWIPSRVAALFMILASFFLGYDCKNAWRIWRRDRYCHASFNSAQTESVCAGALGIRLGGDAYYFGVLHHKKTIGDPIHKLKLEHIKYANRLSIVTAILVLGVCCMMKGVLI